MSNPWAVVAQFEAALAAYTGAPDAVTVDSCTNALGLALRWRARSLDARPHPAQITATLDSRPLVSLPRRTYVGVPMQALHAGFALQWRDEDWQGEYELAPYDIWDAARRFRRGMYHGGLQCVSFHVGKILTIGRGGAILLDDPAAAAWFRKARHDGRTPGVPTERDVIEEAGWHCALSPDEAARGLWRLSWLEDTPADLPNHHTDVSHHPVFR